MAAKKTPTPTLPKVTLTYQDMTLIRDHLIEGHSPKMILDSVPALQTIQLVMALDLKRVEFLLRSCSDSYVFVPFIRKRKQEQT